MSFLAGAAIATLELDANPYRQGFLEAESLMQLFPSMVNSFLANPLLGLAEVAKSTFGILSNALKQSSDRADAMGDMAAKVGVSVEALSGLGLVARQAGSSTEAVGEAYKFLGKSIGEAMSKAKSEQAQAFSALGIGLTNAAGGAKPLEQVMMELADVLQRTENPAQRVKIAMDLLGRSGADLIPTLAQGSREIDQQIQKYARYGAVITTEISRGADAWNDLLGEATFAWEGIQNLMGRPLRDALMPHLQRLMDWVGNNMPQIERGIMTAINTIVAALDKVAKAAAATWDALDSTIGKAADWAAQQIMGDRADTNSVGRPLRTREDALRDKASTYHIHVEPNIPYTQLKQMVDQAQRRADASAYRVDSFEAGLQRAWALGGL